MNPTAHWLGDCAVVVEVADGDERERVTVMLEQGLPGLQVRCGLREVLVESARPTADLLPRVLGVLRTSPVPVVEEHSSSSHVIIEVVYGGGDLAEVAALLAVTADDVIRAHHQQQWRVAMIGFAPGFGATLGTGFPAGFDLVAEGFTTCFFGADLLLDFAMRMTSRSDPGNRQRTPGRAAKGGES